MHRTLPLKAFLLAFVLFPNLPFVIAQQFFHLTRPAINLDYLVLAVLWKRLPKRLNLIFFGFVFVLDAYFTALSTFHFRFSDAVPALLEMRHFSRQTQAVAVLAIAALACMAMLVYWRVTNSRSERRSKRFAAAWLVALVLFANSFSARLLRFQALPLKIADSLFLSAISYKWILPAHRPEPWAVPSATAHLATALRAGIAPTDDVVLVMVESFGEPIDQRAKKWLLDQLVNARVAERYDVRTGTVPFYGATVSGEFRELCGSIGSLEMRNMSRQQLSECLPNLLRRTGYRTTALHGFNRGMFDRQTWYKKFAWDETLFLESQELPDLRLCGNMWRGICDADMAAFIGTRLAKQPNTRQFVYWLTLDAHLDTVAYGGRGSGCQIAGLPDEEVCSLAKVHASTLGAIAMLATKPDLPRTRFIIVGDHAPPYVPLSRRAAFSETHVPFIELMPK